MSLLVAGCIDLPIFDFEAQLDSALLDLGTWSAGPCEDLDRDGLREIVVFAEFATDDTRIPGSGWIVSSRDLKVKCRIEDADAGPGWRQSPLGPVTTLMPILATEPDGSVEWRVVELEPDATGGMRAKWEIAAHSDQEAAPTDPVAVTAGASERPAPTLKMKLDVFVLEKRESSSWKLVEWGDRTEGEPTPSTPTLGCGDFDGDGVLDSLTLCDKPARVKVVSGRDGQMLREISLDDAPFATAATGTCDIGDVDGDLIGDVLVGAQVSSSDERLSPRRCELGLLSIVSGADGSVLRSLDRETLLASEFVQSSIRGR